MPPPVSRFLMPPPPLCRRCHRAAFFNTALMRLRCRPRPAVLLPPLCCRCLSCSADAVAVMPLPSLPCRRCPCADAAVSVLPPLPPLCCSSCCRCPAALLPRSLLPLSCRRAPANTALLPPHCRHRPRVANSATTLPTVTAPLRPCSRCSASVATALPLLTQPICHRNAAAGLALPGAPAAALPPLPPRCLL